MELYAMSLGELRKALDNKEASSKEITEAFLKRISQFNPELNAFITVTQEEALSAAGEADARLARGDRVTPLTGIPVAVADNICTQGVRTTCSSRMLENFIAPYNATVVSRLKEAGAVLVGKTNLDEFAAGTTTEYSRFGPARNPWDLSRTPGGAGGAAAAVAAGLAPLAVASDTGGSLRRAAAFCGLTGIKPAYGRVSRYGLAALGSSLEQAGPLARRVKDAVALYQVIAGPDPYDTTCLPTPVEALDRLVGDISGLKIGFPREYFTGAELLPEMKDLLFSTVKSLEEMGVRTVEVSLPSARYALAAHIILAAGEGGSNLARYDGVRYGYRSPETKDILSLYTKSRQEGFGDEVKRRIILGTMVLSAECYDDYYLRAQKIRTLVREEFSQVFTDCDLILAPVNSGPPPKMGEKRDPLDLYLEEYFTVAANLTGIPALSVPGGLVDGLPAGVQLMGPAGAEGTLLRVAQCLETAAGELSSPLLKK